MNQDRRNQVRRRRIQTLSQTIKELSAQLNQLIIESSNQQQLITDQAQQNRQPAAITTEHCQASDNEFEINNRVEITNITNNYQGLRGARGVVTCITV